MVMSCNPDPNYLETEKTEEEPQSAFHHILSVLANSKEPSINIAPP